MLTDKHKQELRDKINLCRKLAREAIEAEINHRISTSTDAKCKLARDAWKALDDWIYKEL